MSNKDTFDDIHDDNTITLSFLGGAFVAIITLFLSLIYYIFKKDSIGIIVYFIGVVVLIVLYIGFLNTYNENRKALDEAHRAKRKK